MAGRNLQNPPTTLLQMDEILREELLGFFLICQVMRLICYTATGKLIQLHHREIRITGGENREREKD